MSGCPLCCSRAIASYGSVGDRDYSICRTCELVWLAPEQRPDRGEELAEYLLHENDPADPGYRKHLSKLTGRMLPLLAPATGGSISAVAGAGDFGDAGRRGN